LPHDLEYRIEDELFGHDGRPASAKPTARFRTEWPDARQSTDAP
jgi:hypothetical protein